MCCVRICVTRRKLSDNDHTRRKYAVIKRLNEILYWSDRLLYIQFQEANRRESSPTTGSKFMKYNFMFKALYHYSIYQNSFAFCCCSFYSFIFPLSLKAPAMQFVVMSTPAFRPPAKRASVPARRLLFE